MHNHYKVILFHEREYFLQSRLDFPKLRCIGWFVHWSGYTHSYSFKGINNIVDLFDYASLSIVSI